MTNIKTLLGALDSATPISSTCDLCDEHKSDYPDALRVLSPVFKNLGGLQKFSGLVSTVQCFEDNSCVKAAVESPGYGRVLVVDGGGSLRRALLGGNLAGAAAANGWAGVVVNGCVRDAAELAQTKLGIKALALVPLPTHRLGAGQRDVTVQIQGIVVNPGDWLCADEDGMVVLPPPR